MSLITCMESIFITAVVEAFEEPDVAGVNIPSTFQRNKASDGTIIKLQYAVIEVMVQTNISWKQYVVKKGKNSH